MRLGMGVLALACIGCAGTIAELTDAVQAGLHAKRPDSEIARLVAQASPTEPLDDAAIDALEWEGAGPLTVAALDALRDKDLPPAPPAEQRTRALESARQIALRYSAGLPDFICTATVLRYRADPAPPPWNPRDTLTVEVAYSDQGERYRLVAINEKPTRKKLAQTGGFHSSGEFGSLLLHVFAPESATAFQWERWTTLRGRRAYVFSYRINLAHSEYTLNLGSFLKHLKTRTGMKGLVYIDAESSEVLRVSAEADGIPPDWPVLRSIGLLDYTAAEVGGRVYLLPRRSDSLVVMRNEQVRNVTEFGAYRKFSSEATVTFEKQP